MSAVTGLLDISAPKKKNLAPPPPIPKFAADTLPAPRPLPSWRPPPPSCDFQQKSTPPLPPPRTPPSASPSRKKKIKNIRNVHQGVHLPGHPRVGALEWEPLCGPRTFETAERRRQTWNRALSFSEPLKLWYRQDLRRACFQLDLTAGCISPWRQQALVHMLYVCDPETTCSKIEPAPAESQGKSKGGAHKRGLELRTSLPGVKMGFGPPARNR